MAKLYVEGTFGELYTRLLGSLLAQGDEVLIRRTNQVTKELTSVSLHLTDAQANVLVHPARSLNYRFLIAEWLWILAGREDVGSIAYYNSKIAWYSDDGKTFAGAYGPRLAKQWDYLLKTLREDPSSRQAVATIWTPNPPKTRDTPCTVAAQFLIREGKLHGIFTMRSSDAWKGVVYDAFNFSQLTNWLAGELKVETGSLTMHLGSSHLYQEEWKLAETVIARSEAMETLRSPQLRTQWGMHGRAVLNDVLWSKLEFSDPIWKLYSECLRAETSLHALTFLRILHEQA